MTIANALVTFTGSWVSPRTRQDITAEQAVINASYITGRDTDDVYQEARQAAESEPISFLQAVERIINRAVHGAGDAPEYVYELLYQLSDPPPDPQDEIKRELERRFVARNRRPQPHGQTKPHGRPVR